MNAIEVLSKLKRLGSFPAKRKNGMVLCQVRKFGKVSPEALEFARANREVLELFLNPELCLHIHPLTFGVERNDKSRPGWVKMTCSRCGRFVGYRQADAVEPPPKIRKVLSSIPGVITGSQFVHFRETFTNAHSEK